MAIARTTEPATEPITLEEAKLFIKQDETADDDLIENLIIASRQYVEKRTGLALITQSWTATMPDLYPYIDLNPFPLQSITSMTYKDVNGNNQSLTYSSYYWLDTLAKPPTLSLKSGVSLPTVINDCPNAVSIVYEVGYGDDAEDVPYTLRLIIQQMVAQWYLHREPTIEGSLNVIPYSAQALLDNYWSGANV
jgi:uncharacterized phiE125 gp8 family phage protein